MESDASTTLATLPDALIEHVLSFLSHFDLQDGHCAASSKGMLVRVEALCRLSLERLEQRADSTFRFRVGAMLRGTTDGDSRSQGDEIVARMARHMTTPDWVTISALPWRRLLVAAQRTHLYELGGRHSQGQLALGCFADYYLLSQDRYPSDSKSINVWDISCTERVAEIRNSEIHVWERLMNAGSKLILAGRDEGVAIYDMTHSDTTPGPAFDLRHRIRGLSAVCVSGDALFAVTEELIPFDVQDQILPVKLVRLSLDTGEEMDSADLPEGLAPSDYTHMCASGGGCHLFIPLCHRTDRGSDAFILRKAQHEGLHSMSGVYVYCTATMAPPLSFQPRQSVFVPGLRMLTADSSRVATISWMRTDGFCHCLVHDAMTLKPLIGWPLPEPSNAHVRSDRRTLLLQGDALFIGDGGRMCIDVWVWRTASIAHTLCWPAVNANCNVRSLVSDGRDLFVAFEAMEAGRTDEPIKVWAVPLL